MVIFYSGTGNSRIIAKTLADELGDKVTDSFGCIKSGNYEKYRSEMPWIFVCPTYAWRMPRIFENFIRESRFEGSKEAYFIMTCGDGIGNAAKHIKQLCTECGFDFRGVRPIIMPENYVAMFDTPEKEETEEIVKDGIAVAKETAEYIKKRLGIPKPAVGVFDTIKSGIINRGFYYFFVKPDKFYVKDSCVSCGMCEKLCPCNAIVLADRKPVWVGGCTHCMACINACPKKAIEYGRASKGKPRIYNGESR